MDDVSRAADFKAHESLGGFIAIAAFVMTEVIFVIRYNWGLVLGLVPAPVLAGAFGWISFRFIWVGVATAALIEFALSLGA